MGEQPKSSPRFAFWRAVRPRVSNPMLPHLIPEAHTEPPPVHLQVVLPLQGTTEEDAQPAHGRAGQGHTVQEGETIPALLLAQRHREEGPRGAHAKARPREVQ